uniref:Uncharacterized protein n=1 Tax=Marseillevirus LCMAC101 TaxID=2506602 RepID=A0A481YRJ9_9VIRU|nr:MAG: hypothetical protein LCMAC101_04460 [Marseillevirus LCMAC101]
MENIDPEDEDEWEMPLEEQMGLGAGPAGGVMLEDWQGP